MQADFTGGDVTSDAGVLLLREVDRILSLTRDVARVIPDQRAAPQVLHSVEDLLRQRVYGIALGYEDQNDHDEIRFDLALQTSVGRDGPLASQPTINRFENSVPREAVVRIHEILLEKFIASFEEEPEELVLDFDATDDPVHGDQEGRFFHGYYDRYCFLPLYVFCGQKLLVAYLRPSNRDGARHSRAIFKLLVKRLRQAWPKVRIIFRGDSGFCRHRLMDWCEKQKNVFYIVGLATNRRLERMTEKAAENVRLAYEKTGEFQKVFRGSRYSAKSWKRDRRVIHKVEYGSKGQNIRHVVTNLPGDRAHLYNDLYCQRGDMENRIKEQQLYLFSDRTSAHRWWSNQFRVLLSGLAYVLIEHLRSEYLAGTELLAAQVETIRRKLFKIGAVIIRNTRRVRVMLSSAYPYKRLFRSVCRQLVPI